MGKMSKIGKVYIIGAGPGDAGLITLKAVDCLRLADVVIYDKLRLLPVLFTRVKKAGITPYRKRKSTIFW
jgi:siroheme synthase